MEEYIPVQTRPVLAECWRPRNLNDMLDLLANLSDSGYSMELHGDSLLMGMGGDTLHRVDPFQYVVLEHDGSVKIMDTKDFQKEFKLNHG